MSLRDRAQSAVPERRIIPNFGAGWTNDDYSGENIAWAGYWSRRTPGTFHADKHCPYLPDTSLIAHPMSVARAGQGRWNRPDPCHYCTTDE